MAAVKKSRDSLIDEGAIRRIEAQPSLANNDIPFECPPGWAWVRFGEISSSYRGHNPPKSVFRDKPTPGYVRFIQQRDFRTDDHAVYVPESRHLKLVRKGEIVMAAYGNIGNTCRTVEGAFNVAITKVMEIPPVERDYIDLIIRSDFIRGALEKVSSRVAVPSMSSDHMRSLAVPLPPLAEQKRIVAKVNELMALFDRLEAQQQEREARHAALARASLARFADAPTPANLDLLFHSSFNIQPSDLRKSILTLAVQGKLVPQDPNDEPVKDSFPTLAAASFESDEDGFPAHWLRVPLGKMGEWRGGGTPSKSRPEFWKGDLPWVSPKDMKVLHIADAQDHISPAAVEGSSVRIIPSGSLLMVVRGMILARAFPVALTTREVTINQDIKALLPFEPRTKDYLLTALRGFDSDVLAAIEHSSHGTCKLKTEFLQDFVMPIPPLAEQRRIVAKVDQLMALVDSLEAQLAASRATAANLLSALVAERTQLS